jgi:hypothetical protein
MNLSTPRRLHLEEWLLAAATTVNILVALLAKHFPYQDVINHLARYFLIDRALSGQPVGWVEVRLVPTSYIGADLVGVALLHTLGAGTTLRLMAILPLLLLPAGMYALLRVAAPSQCGWALVGVLLSFSWFYLGGFISYTVGLGLTLFLLAAWWPGRADCSWARRVALAFGCIGLFLVHLSAPLLALAVMGLDLLLATFLAGKGDRVVRGSLSSRFGTVAVVSLGLIVVWGLTHAARDEVPSMLEPPTFRTPPAKLTHLASPFYSFSLAQMAVMGGAYLVAVISLASLNRRERWSDVFWLSGLLFLALYLVSPSRANAAGDVDTRWLLPAYLLPFCRASRMRPSTPVLLAIFGLCCLHAGIVRHYAVAIDRELTDMDRALDKLPSGSRVLPLVTDQRQHGHIIPYLHFALWHTIRKDGRVPGLFSGRGARENDPLYPHLNHFRALRLSYLPDGEWGVTNWEPLDCRRIRDDYDYVLQAGKDDRAEELIERCAAESYRVGEATVYRVAGTSAPAAPGR